MLICGFDYASHTTVLTVPQSRSVVYRSGNISCRNRRDEPVSMRPKLRRSAMFIGTGSRWGTSSVRSGMERGPRL